MKSNVGRIASVVWTGVLWTALAWPAAAGAAAEAQASTYVDPQSRFTIAVPPGAELVDVGNGLEFSIRSRAGYAINVQTAEANLNMGLDEMVRRFENQHLGPSKAVSTKLSERFATIGGLSAYDAVYEGSRTRMRVVIARGAETDYAFLFFAPARKFAALVGEFDSVLATFQPSEREKIATASPAPEPTAAEPIEIRSASADGGRRFVTGTLGYAIDYPRDWTVDRPSESVVVFGGEEGSEQYFNTVTIQNIAPDAAGDPRQAVTAVMSDLKAAFSTHAEDVQFMDEGQYVYDRDGVRLTGLQFLVTYSRGGYRFKQWTIVMPRTAEPVAHVWSYASPETEFPAAQRIARLMLDSWVLNAVGERVSHAVVN